MPRSVARKVFALGRRAAIGMVLVSVVLTGRLSAANLAQADVAAWIAEVGGALERNTEGEIVAVDLESAWITDDDLRKLGALPELRRINLSFAKIGDLGLAHLRPLRNVTYLNCFHCAYITDGGIAYLKEWKHLEYLNLQGTEVTSRVFEHLAGMSKLQFLDVGFSRVNDDGFDALAELEQLEELRIGGDKMTGLALPLLRLLPGLKRLDVSGSQRTDSGRWGLMLTDGNIESIAALSHLEELSIGGSLVSDAGMQAIGSLVNLETLDLSRMDITARGLEPVAKLPRLERLSLWRAERIDDRAGAFLAAMPSLAILDLGDTAVTDALLDQLEEMNQLKVLLVGGTRVTPERVERFRKSRPDCRIIWAPRFKEVESEEDTRLIG